MSQKALLTWRNTPSGVITTRPTEARSNASRTRSKSIRGSRAITLIACASAHPCRAGRRIERGAAQRASETRSQAIRQALEHVVPRREIHHLVGLDDFARDVVEAPQAIGEPEIHALLAGPDESREHIRRFLQALASPRANDVDELLVDLREHLLRMLLVRRILGRERIEEILVLPGGVRAPLDAELLHRIDEAEARDDHADGAHEARLVDVDPVGRARHVVTARCAQVLHHDIERLFPVLGAKAAPLVADLTRLHPASAR